MLIYKVTNIINGKVYIGQTTRSLAVRKNEHTCHALSNYSNTVFSKALRKYGIDGFTWEEIYHAFSIEELNNIEKIFIKKYNSSAADKSGYNIEDGGRSSIPSEQTKEKMSRIKKQQKYVDIAMKNLPSNSNGINNGRYKEVDIHILAHDFKEAKLTYKDLQKKFNISRATVLRKLKHYFSYSFSVIRKKREIVLEKTHGISHNNR